MKAKKMSIQPLTKTTTMEIPKPPRKTGLPGFWQGIVDFFHRRTDPFPELTDSEDRRKARMLAGLTFVLSIFMAVGAVANTITSTLDHGSATFSLPPIESAVIGLTALGTYIGYRFSRGRHYQLGGWFAILTIFLFLIGMILFFPAIAYSMLTVFTFPVLLATIILPARYTVRVFLICLALDVLVLLALQVNVDNFMAISLGTLCFSLMMVLLANLREEDIAQVRRLRDLESGERERLSHELELARRVQLSMLPKELPILTGCELAAYSEPALEASGDFYDIFMLHGHHSANGTGSQRCGIVVCDVAGKGVSSALVMSATRAALRSEASRLESPAEVLERVNEALYGSIPVGLFATLFYGVYDPPTRTLQFASAGHPFPYKCGKGQVSELENLGMPVGLVAESQYEDRQTTLAPGETLFIFTDGLVEALNPKREMLGFDGVRDRIAHITEQQVTPQELIQGTLREMRDFMQSEPQHDDITVVALRVS